MTDRPKIESVTHPTSEPRLDGRWSAERLATAPITELFELCLELHARFCKYDTRLMFEASRDANAAMMQRLSLYRPAGEGRASSVPARRAVVDALYAYLGPTPVVETIADRMFALFDLPPAVPAGETRDEPLWAGRMRWMAAHSADFCYMTTMSAQLSKGGGIHSVEDHGTKIGVRVPKSDDYGYEVYDAPSIAEAIDKAARETKHQPVVAYTAVQLSPALPPSHAGEANG